MPLFSLPTLTRRMASSLADMSPRDIGRIGLLVIDPRGRCNRQAMTVMTVVFLVIQMLLVAIANLIGGETGVTVFHVFNTPLMLVGLIALVKRLHDIGLSGFWAPAAATLWVAAAFVATLALVLLVGADHMAAVVSEKGPLYWLVFSFVAVPAFGGFIWLHSTPGTSGANAYGPLPGDSGFGPGHRSARADTSLPSDAIAAS